MNYLHFVDKSDGPNDSLNDKFAKYYIKANYILPNWQILAKSGHTSVGFK